MTSSTGAEHKSIDFPKAQQSMKQKNHSAGGLRLSVYIPAITGYISEKKKSSAAIDQLENMDECIFNEALLQAVWSNIDLSQAIQGIYDW